MRHRRRSEPVFLVPAIVAAEFDPEVHARLSAIFSEAFRLSWASFDDTTRAAVGRSLARAMAAIETELFCERQLAEMTEDGVG